MQLVHIHNINKKIWTRTLFNNLDLTLEEGEKTALVGRNGVGKTTLFRMLSGEDKDYAGTIDLSRGLSIVVTQQEHFLVGDISVLDYILASVPQYTQLHQIVFIDHDKVTQDAYMEAITRYTDLGYYHVADQIISTLESFQISEERCLMPLSEFSGGEKRFIELVRVMFSKADLALIDEPTNHMDIEGKQKFLDWMRQTEMTLLIITHDRDVLTNVNKIIELKDYRAFTFKGNYEYYLKNNSLVNRTSIHEYEVRLKQQKELQAKIDEIESFNTISQALKVRLNRYRRDIEIVEEGLEKPSFWIDQDSLAESSEIEQEKYNKYKQRSIAIHGVGSSAVQKKLLIKATNLSLGYDTPLFPGLNFELYQSDTLRLLGRNGAGKSTLIKYIISKQQEREAQCTWFGGNLRLNNGIKIGIYEQEVNKTFLDLTLEQGLVKLYKDENIEISDKMILSILDAYLFDKKLHLHTKLGELSGGEKARFQLIKMMLNEPNLLILDEPTNHLDLPSIEELEVFLKKYIGAIIYVSHDSFFAKNLGGKEITVAAKA